MLELILDIILAFYTTFTFLIGPERRYRTWNLDDYKALLGEFQRRKHTQQLC